MYQLVLGLLLALLSAGSASAQYNVAPLACTNQGANWTGSAWQCASMADTADMTSVASTQTAKQTLKSRALAAGYLGTNGNCVRVTAWGTAKATTNNKTQTIDFGATTVASTGAVANNGGSWIVSALVCRTGATAQVATQLKAQSASTFAATSSTTPAETLANSITIAVTSTNVTDTDGTTAKALIVERVN